MAAGDHVINNKKVDPKKAKARHGKIFVGGLSTELSDDDIKNFFSQFGTVSDLLSVDTYKYMRVKMCAKNWKKLFRSLKWKCRSTRLRIREKDSASLPSSLSKWSMNC